jgi:hypothetical protein
MDISELINSVASKGANTSAVRDMIIKIIYYYYCEQRVFFLFEAGVGGYSMHRLVL